MHTWSSIRALGRCQGQPPDSFARCFDATQLGASHVTGLKTRRRGCRSESLLDSKRFFVAHLLAVVYSTRARPAWCHAKVKSLLAARLICVLRHAHFVEKI
jgi:hypothetical protein